MLSNSALEKNALQLLLGQIDEPVLIIDASGFIRYYSKGFSKQTSLKEESLIGYSLLTIDGGSWLNPCMQSSMNELLGNQAPFRNTEVCLDLPNARQRKFLASGFSVFLENIASPFYLIHYEDRGPVRASHNKRLSLAMTLRSQRSELEFLEEAFRIRTNELEAANTKLREANQDLTSFNYISNHDLQEPLRKIQNFVACIQGDHAIQLTDASSMYFKKISDAALRMQGLLDDVLRYSMIRDKDRIFKKCDLTQLVREVVKDFKQDIEKKQARLDIQSLGVLDVVPDQFKELVKQIVGNALKFHKPEQRPSLSIKSRYLLSDSEHIVGISGDEQYLNLIFEDEGIGFNEQFSEKIFEVFQRLHPIGVYDGTGIGLPICKRIVEHHRGRIKASGEINKGMRIDIYLPIRQGMLSN